MREKVGKSRNTVFLQWFGAPEGRKVGSLKRRVRSQLARWEMKNCMQVKMYKTPGLRSAFRSWDVEKVHAVVARSTCRNSARCCGAQHISKSKSTTHHMYAPLLDVEASFCLADARDCAPCQKWAKCEGFVAFPKTMAGVGHLKRICKDAFSVAGAMQRAARRSGCWFPDRVCILEHQICRFAKMILRDRCNTSYDLASLFRGRRST